MKQLGIACHNYHDKYDQFPFGALDRNNGDSNSSLWRWFSMWGVSILPFMEQQSVYDLYFPAASLQNATLGSVNASNQGKNRELAMMRMPIYECPSDVGMGEASIPTTELGHTHYTPFEQYVTSYKGVAGANTGGVWWWDQNGGSGATVRAYMRGILHNFYSTGGEGGTLQVESFASVTDGSSNTTLFVERHRTDNQGIRRNTYWSSIPANHLYTSSPKTATFYSHYWDKCIDMSGLTASTDAVFFCGRSAGTYHSSGMNVTFGDGSVHFVSNMIDVGVGWASATSDIGIIGVWGCLCAVADGTTVEVP